MPPLWLRIGSTVARVLVRAFLRPHLLAGAPDTPMAAAEHRARYSGWLEESTPEEQQAAIRRGQIIFGLWLHSVWVVASEIAWIVLGRHPWWSAHRLGLGVVAGSRDHREYEQQDAQTN